MMKYFLLISVLVLSGCTIGYKVSGDRVSWVHWNEGTGRVVKELEVSDSSEFVVLDSGYAKGPKKVFYEGQVIEGADPSSFVILSGTYSADESSVFFMNLLVEGVAPKNISTIGTNYAVIDGSVYYRNHEIIGAEPNAFEISNFENSDVYQCYLAAEWFGCSEPFLP